MSLISHPPYDPYSYANAAPENYGFSDDGNGINTLFVSGLPDDVKAREIHNLFRRRPGFDSCQLKYTGRGNQVVAFATFENHHSAIAALHSLNGVKFDPQTGHLFHIELARSNSRRIKRPGSGPYVVIDRRTNSAADAQETSSEDGDAECDLPSGPSNPDSSDKDKDDIAIPKSGETVADADNAVIAENQHEQIETIGDGAKPCSTLFIANLGPNCTKDELQQVLSQYPGFNTLKVRDRGGMPVAFADFEEIEKANVAMNALQDSTLPSSDRGGMHIEYARRVVLMTTRISAISSSISRSLPLCYVRRRPPDTLTALPKSQPCPLWSSSFSLCLLRNSTSRLPVSPVRSFSASAVSDRPRMTAAIDESLRDNPLLKDFDFPPFDCVQADHVRPGIRALLNKLEGELAELESTVEPSWPKLVEPLEKITDRLAVVWGAVNHLKAVKDTPELRSAIEEVQPEKVKFELKLGQSKPIYNAFKAIKESPDWEALSAARKRIVDSQIKEAVLSGVSLEDDKRDQFNKIEQELAKLTEKFGENVLDATKKFEKLITDKKDIEGLPATALGLGAQTAVSKGHENATAENGPWVITLDAPSFMSVMQHAKNRALREEVYRAYVSRASSGELDNTSIIDQILKLRLEKAKLLGYNNYAEVSMATKMATIDKAEELLEKLRAASWDAAVKDLDELKQFSKDQGAPEANDLNHWDTTFWSERLSESKYEINEEELRPYFSLPKVMGGLFNLAKMLFEITIEAADGLAPVWNNDVRFYCVKDSSGSPIAYFYFDPYSRPSEKRGGAWMDEVFARSRVLSQDGASARLPVAHMVCNQMPPVGNKPSLVTFREVETVFHEFGHALQHMLTKQDEGLVAGIRGIEWDAVELPSQFMENWCYHRDTLMSIAKHYETGESLPDDIYFKLLASRTFRAGSLSLRQIRFASVDLELHTKYVPGGSESIYDVDQRVSQKTQVIPPLPEDRFLCGFSHIFAGGYAAGYYSYKWAEVLSADAFSAFEDAGLNDDKAVKETGHKFRETILALGGGKAPLEVFVEFRGREPSPEPLLRHNGLLAVSA